MVATYVKGINGLRAITALVILWGHIPHGSFAQWIVFSVPLPICCAYVFFVVSGFLAGWRHDNAITLRDYYKKKAQRLLPLYYSYILLTIILYCALGWKNEVIDYRLWYYLFLVPNIPFANSSGILPLAHLWFIGSLTLFYLVFPLLAKIGKDKMLLVSAVCCMGSVLLKFAIYLFIGKDTFLYRYWSVLGFDCSFGGVFLGQLMKKQSHLIEGSHHSSSSRIIRFISWILFLTSGLYGKYLPAPTRVEFIAFLSGILIFDQLSSKPILNLEKKVLNWLGKISYEIYVSQILIIILLSSLYCRLNLSFPDVLIYSLVTVLVIAFSWAFHLLLSCIRPKRITTTR